MNNVSQLTSPLEDIVGQLAHSLRDVINETDETDLEKTPEDAYADLACRLVLRLAKAKLTILPGEKALAARTHDAKNAAAARILDNFTRWLDERPDRHCIIGFDPLSKLKFEIVMRERGETRAFFRGVSVQDACGQAAQTLEMNEGEL